MFYMVLMFKNFSSSPFVGHEELTVLEVGAFESDCKDGGEKSLSPQTAFGLKFGKTPGKSVPGFTKVRTGRSIPRFDP
jgi:hypothetical protein